MDARKALSLLIGVAALSACGYRPFDYHSQQEIPRGPGALTGEDGAVVLRAKQSPQANDEEQREFREWREWREWKRQQHAK
jgi:hypothetical protein